MRISKFMGLESWKETYRLILLIYRITNSLPKTELYGLISQLRCAEIYIESCIAKELLRYHYKDRLRFYI